MTISTIAVLSSIILAAPTVDRFEGEARDDAGALRYRETHEVHRDGARTVRALTRYFDPRGRLLGELRSEYGDDRYAPSYTFADAGGRTLEGARLEADGLHLRFADRSRVIGLERDGARLVLGQGLNLLARDRLDALARGEEMTVRFAIPSRLDVYEFRIGRTDTPHRELVRLRVKIDNLLLALFAPSLEVDYDRRSGRLLRYRGVSNLADENGETQRVTIRYRYPPESNVAGEAAR